MQGQCDYQTYNFFGNSMMFYLTDTSIFFVKNCLFLYIFWRRRINSFASQNIRGTIKKSYAAVATNSPKWRQSNSMLERSDILKKSKSLATHHQGNQMFQSGAIFVGMSQGNSDTISFASDSSYKKNQQIAEAYENDLYEQAASGSRVQSLTANSLGSHFMITPNQKARVNRNSRHTQN